MPVPDPVAWITDRILATGALKIEPDAGEVIAGYVAGKGDQLADDLEGPDGDVLDRQIRAWPWSASVTVFEAVRFERHMRGYSAEIRLRMAEEVRAAQDRRRADLKTAIRDGDQKRCAEIIRAMAAGERRIVSFIEPTPLC